MEDKEFVTTRNKNFINFDEVITLINREVQYSSGILTGCDGYVITEKIEGMNYRVTVRFERFHVKTAFDIELALNGLYDLDEIKEKIEQSCRTAIIFLVNRSYKIENFLT